MNFSEKNYILPQRRSNKKLAEISLGDNEGAISNIFNYNRTERDEKNLLFLARFPLPFYCKIKSHEKVKI